MSGDQSPFRAAYAATYICLNDLRALLAWREQSPTPNAANCIAAKYRESEASGKALEVVVYHLLPYLMVHDATKTVCGMEGACWLDAIWRLHRKVQIDLFTAAPDVETSTAGITEHWPNVQEALSRLDANELDHADTEAQRELALAEVQVRNTTGGNGTTITENTERKGNSVTGGKGDGSTGGGGGAVELSGEAKALAILLKHPDWSNTRIAKEVPCYRTSLHKWKGFVTARKLLKEQGKRELPHGSKYEDEGMEAWDEE